MDKETREYLDRKLKNPPASWGDSSTRVELGSFVFARLDSPASWGDCGGLCVFNTIDERFTRIDDRFTRIDEKVAGIDGRFTGIDERFEETKRHFGVVAEGLRNDIRQVAEGVINVGEKLDREITALRDEMRTELKNPAPEGRGFFDPRGKEPLIFNSLANPALEGRGLRSLCVFNEVKSMIKFSYTELDRRIRTLEEDFSALKSRVERLETRMN